MYAFSSDPSAQAGQQNGLGPQDSESLGQELTTGLAGQLIRRAVYRICCRLGLSASEGEELEQELRLQVVLRSRHFDPERAPWHSFVAVVVDRCSLTLWRRLRRQPLPESLDADGDEDLSPSERVADDEHDRRTGARSRSQVETFGLEHDLAEVLDMLEPELAEFCRLLKEHPVARAARKLDLPRSTFRDRLQKVREIFADHDLDKYL